MSGIETRHAPRDSLLLFASARFNGGKEECRVKVRNISAGGLMAEGAAPPARGANLSIKLRNIGWVDGVVVWVQDNRFGVAFAREIDAKLVRTREVPKRYETPGFVRPASLLPASRQNDTHRVRNI